MGETSTTSVQRGVLLGLLGGFVVASVGAWKDTLYEEFEPAKFIRSPIIAAVAGGVWGKVYPTLPSFPLLSCAVITERAVVEGWKAVIRKPPGKFTVVGRDSGWLWKRIG